MEAFTRTLARGPDLRPVLPLGSTRTSSTRSPTRSRSRCPSNRNLAFKDDATNYSGSPYLGRKARAAGGRDVLQRVRRVLLPAAQPRPERVPELRRGLRRAGDARRASTHRPGARDGQASDQGAASDARTPTQVGQARRARPRADRRRRRWCRRWRSRRAGAAPRSGPRSSTPGSPPAPLALVPVNGSIDLCAKTGNVTIAGNERADLGLRREARRPGDVRGRTRAGPARPGARDRPGRHGDDQAAQRAERAELARVPRADRASCPTRPGSRRAARARTRSPRQSRAPTSTRAGATARARWPWACMAR